MKILQLCKKFPFPLKDGEAIAVSYMAKAYSALGHSVDLLSMNTSKHWFDLAKLPANYDHYGDIQTIFVNNDIKPLPAFLNLFSRESYHVTRFDKPDFAEALRICLQKQAYDVVQLESLYMAPYIPVIRQHSKALVVLRAHNVEHEIWERVASNSGFFKRWYLQQITPRLKRYEIERLNDYDMVLSISQRDLEHFESFGLKKPAMVAPIGLDLQDYTPNDTCYTQPLSLSFIGSLDWMPNQEGLAWFLDAIWKPLLLPRFPDLRFHIAGRTAPDWIQNLQIPGVIFHGEVPSAADFINRHAVMVAPLLSGGGMRAKILEAMAVGKAVLSTTLGMEGIDAVDGESCLLADTPEDFVRQIERLYRNAGLAQEIGERGRSLCANRYNNLETARNVVDRFRLVSSSFQLVS